MPQEHSQHQVAWSCLKRTTVGQDETNPSWDRDQKAQVGLDRPHATKACIQHHQDWNPQGKRKVSRPKQTWRRSTDAEIKAAGTTWAELKTTSQNRVRWRGVVAALGSSRSSKSSKWPQSRGMWALVPLSKPATTANQRSTRTEATRGALTFKTAAKREDCVVLEALYQQREATSLPSSQVGAWPLHCSDRLVGLVVRRPPREWKIPGSNPACSGIFSGSSHTSDIKIDTPVATLPVAWRYRVRTGTGRTGVSVLWLGEIERWICNFCLSVAAREIVWADPSLRYTSLLLGR